MTAISYSLIYFGWFVIPWYNEYNRQRFGWLEENAIVNKQRPINIYLLSYKYPVTAIISVVHRFSGALVFFLIPFLLWLLSESLSTPEQFVELQSALMNPFTKFVLWITLSALLCHLVAGVRHLLMDMGFGETLKAGKSSAWAALIISAILILLTGIWLW